MIKNINSRQLRKMFLDFFESKGHKIIKGSSLIPENDPTVLFTTAGMHPLVPYLLGEPHPAGKRLTNIQRCIRTADIDEVGDATHCTFFEMLGNWSLGDYFKEEAIKYSWEFLTDPKYLGIPKEKLFFTVFEGENAIPKDLEAYNVWRSLGVEEDHLYFLPRENNWWGPAGQTGPCGPDTEMFVDTGKEACSKDCSPACNCGKYVEIWNDVFMEYNKTKDGTYEISKQKNVDTGMGSERVLCILNGYQSVYETELFKNIIDKITNLSNKNYQDYLTSFRVIADHIRTATFILGDEFGVAPSNTEQGYVLRRLIRRMIRHLGNLDINHPVLADLATIIINDYADLYPELLKNQEFIKNELTKEELAFKRTINQGIKEFQKLISKLDSKIINGIDAFHLYDTYGFPIEFTVEMAKELNLEVDINAFNQAFEEHQNKSRLGSEQKFKGGLADNTEEHAKLHTATHLLQAALREKFGPTIEQRGSNITSERLRFDFPFERKITPEELQSIEKRVNEIINMALPVVMEEMTYEAAKAKGAMGLFTDKYDKDQVKVYSIGDFSKEMCGGPHANNTKDLGTFEIQKEESSSAGIRRIKAILK